MSAIRKGTAGWVSAVLESNAKVVFNFSLQQLLWKGGTFKVKVSASLPLCQHSYPYRADELYPLQL